MIQIKEELLKQIEEKLLPIGSSFTEQQKEVIKFNESANIVAGPGSGKSTVLIAKCAMILTENSTNKKGICIITHTNVAVDEIKNGLVNLGYKKFEYPNFIGTIQEFFNYFFGRKAFHLLFGEKQIRILEEEEYKEKFNNIFNSLKPEDYNFFNPNPKNKNPKLVISDDMKVSVKSQAPNSYKSAFNASINRLIINGIMTNEQSLELAEWYISKYENEIKKAIKNRFNYILLDEAQDTNNMQYRLLKKLFTNNIIFQRFGDPYQSLYSVFGNEEDAWIPSDETAVERLDIAETSRFNENIAKYVRWTCFENYDEFKSISSNNSKMPYFISYKDEDELLIKYKKIIDDMESECLEFRKSTKKDAILSVKHADLTRVFGGYTVENTKIKKSESYISQLYNSILKIISREKNISIQEVDENLNSDLMKKRILAKGIRAFTISKSDTKVDIIIDTIEELIGIAINDIRKDSIRKNLSKYVIKNEESSIENNGGKKKIYIGTVHSVKGETHRSTLLLLNTVFENRNRTYSFDILDLIEHCLFGNYIDLDKIDNQHQKRETKNALKLAYVAFSRPTHILVIGIPENKITEEFKKKLRSVGYQYNV